MFKTFHIIPGLGETCRRQPYQKLRKIAAAKDYQVIFHNVNWKKTLSNQIFPIAKNDIVFGFSLGAILAWLIAQKYPCHHLILASMTPHYSFTDRKIKKALIDLVGRRFVNDIIIHLKSKHQAKKQTVIYGDLEEEKGGYLYQKYRPRIKRRLPYSNKKNYLNL